MAHASQIVYCAGPDSPHAFDIVSLQPRNGMLDRQCPVCKGHGQWNIEIDLVSFRCKRATCGRCYGEGWVETGTDAIAVLDIVMTPEGYPKWVTRFIPPEELNSDVQPAIAAAPMAAISAKRNTGSSVIPSPAVSVPADLHTGVHRGK